MKSKDCNGIFGVPHCDWCEEYVECFHKSFNKSQTVTMTGEIKVDEKVKKEIEKLMRSDELTLYVELDNTPEPVAVAQVKRCEKCPEWLFDKVIKKYWKNETY